MTDHAHPSEHGTEHDHRPRHPGTAAEWDARYAQAERIWSGAPNGTLVSEVARLAPGSALDVGCGEGADAVWLARQGWRVTGADLSRVALDRAAQAAAAAGVEVALREADLTDPAVDLGTFDLVTAHYASLPLGDGTAARAMIRAVAPGGTLLVVGHSQAHGHTHGADGGEPSADEAAYWDSRVEPGDVAALLDDAWDVEVHETRERPDAPAAARHSHDVVLRAVRTR